ncbi:serine/threonine protein kinase [Fusarium flagelliforme]|uniref:Serine/threonine protein kinase n=1 Tax=Fusarium flagelliforme TaxID=2675880 RepID=A0A395MIC3_9HYPO|nr:serine/threonine protein kinase [Fusarium flagelliforme]
MSDWFNPVTTSQLLEDFRQHVRENLAKGVNGDGSPVDYVLPSALSDYWTQGKVDAILGYEQSSSEMIVRCFSQVFSILVYIGQPHEITWFCRDVRQLDDTRLPFDTTSFPPACQWQGSFLRTQWMFIPLILTEEKIFDRVLPPQTILPVNYVKPLTERCGGQDTAVLWEVQVHPEANRSQPVVFKISEGSGAEELFKAETKVHLRLRTKSNPYITQHFGSFSFQGKHKYIIVLEYAAGGSLQDFLRTTDLPVTPEDIRLLWSRLLKLLYGLHALHDLHRPDGASDWFLAGVHQDIQPANILVFPEDGSDSPFNVRFKLTDFGLTEIGRVSTSNGTMVTENRGNRMYIAPESFANYRVQLSAKTDIPPTADIWALGAVFSDVLIWSICGETGREKYRLGRQAEIASQPHLKERKIDACFHNMFERLKAVDEFHSRALTDRRQRDDVSPHISQLILDFMLIDQRERMSAIQIKARADRKLKEIQDDSLKKDDLLSGYRSTWGSSNGHSLASGLPQPPYDSKMPIQPLERRQTVPARPRDLNTTKTLFATEPIIHSLPPTDLAELPSPTPQPLPPPSPASNMTEQPLPSEEIVTIDDIYSLMEKPGRSPFKLSTLVPRPDKSTAIMKLPGMEDARRKIWAHEGRDQYRDRVKMAARVIGYVAKPADDDGMEVYSASGTAKKPRKCKNSSQIEIAVDKMETVEGKCDMGACIDHVLDKVLVDGQVKPTSIYIYTDGAWEPGTNVKRVVYRAIEHLYKRGQSTRTIMLQFVQFGHDPHGTELLSFLDNECTMETEKEK